MNKFLFLAFLFFISCGKEKVILLPEISHSKITEIKDVSPAYIFYNETKPDSTELNRKNLISTTHWLVNVDKRLTLKQAIPHIQFLQEKKNSSSHKNEAAKNYYTCNDTSIKNLGFIEFTDVSYKIEKYKPILSTSTNNTLLLDHKKDNSIMMFDVLDDKLISRGFFDLNKSELKNYNTIILAFDKELTFQEYISYKSEINADFPEYITIIKSEFIY
jgi:hypothetical protein